MGRSFYTKFNSTTQEQQLINFQPHLIDLYKIETMHASCESAIFSLHAPWTTTIISLIVEQSSRFSDSLMFEQPVPVSSRVDPSNNACTRCIQI